MYVAIVTKLVHRLQIESPNSAQPEGTPTIPPSHMRVPAVVRNAARDRQTDTQTVVAKIQSASAMLHEKCKNKRQFKLFIDIEKLYSSCRLLARMDASVQSLLLLDNRCANNMLFNSKQYVTQLLFQFICGSCKFLFGYEKDM